LGRSTAIANRAGMHAMLRTAAQVVAGAGLVVVVAFSAIVTKQVRSRSELTALAQLDSTKTTSGRVHEQGEPVVGAECEQPASEPSLVIEDPLGNTGSIESNGTDDSSIAASGDEEAEASSIEAYPPDTRWFNGRPVRPTKVITMLVTAYTPDEISCGASADGVTASLHSVWTNAMRLVAADSKVLPLGSMISVPGYADNSIVPVLDRGGKIKGNRLDVLFADNPTARKWGAQKLKITVWAYVDGQPAEDWRAIRDSRK